MKKSLKSFNQLTDRQKVFVSEYVIDLNASRAAKEAGYKSTNGVKGAQLVKSPKIAAAIKEALEPSLRACEITKDSVLEQLRNFLFRDIIHFLDDDGYLTKHPASIPPEARQCIDSWECFREYTEDGEIKSERWKVKLVGKGQALDLAMKYLRLIGPETINNNTNVTFNWQEFFTRAAQPVQEPIDAKLRRLITTDEIIRPESDTEKTDEGS